MPSYFVFKYRGTPSLVTKDGANGEPTVPCVVSLCWSPGSRPDHCLEVPGRGILPVTQTADDRMQTRGNKEGRGGGK